MRSSPFLSQTISRTLIAKYVVMTIISQAKGDVRFKPTNIRQMRWMPPRSIKMNAPAQQMHAVDVITAGIATFLKDSMRNTWAEEATIKPPAESPTKNMKQVI